MGFFTGRLTCMRFRVGGRSLRSFGREQLEQLAAHAMGRQRMAAADGSAVGWIAADHILDTRFDLAKNIVNDALHFALRIDTLNIPADLLRAYTQVELEGLAASNPSGLKSARQKREARQLAKDRLEKEAQDGRFLRRKAIPLLWDAPSRHRSAAHLVSPDLSVRFRAAWGGPAGISPCRGSQSNPRRGRRRPQRLCAREGRDGGLACR